MGMSETNEREYDRDKQPPVMDNEIVTADSQKEAAYRNTWKDVFFQVAENN